MKLAQYSKYVVGNVGADDLVLWHQGISSYSADYTPICFQLFMG